MINNSDKIDFDIFFAAMKNIEIKIEKDKKYTLPCIFKKQYGENFISDWLAYILDPSLNGIGVEPLQILLNLSRYKFSINDDANIIIEREHVFENGRRIDLYIEIDDLLVIAIENKINSGLSDNQLDDYYKSINLIKKPETDICCIFLKPQYNNAHVNNGFLQITYEDLIAEFKKVQVDFIENLRPAFLFKEFIVHIEEYIMEANNPFSLEDDLIEIINNKELLDKITKRYNDANEQLKAEIVKELNNKFDNDTWKEIPSNRNSCYIQLYKHNWNSKGIHYEFLIEDSIDLLRNDVKYIVVLHVETSNKEEKDNIIRQLRAIPLKNNLISGTKKNEVAKILFERSFNSTETIENNVKEIIEAFQLLDQIYSKKIEEILINL